MAEKLNADLYLIDCHDLGMEQRTGSYVLKGQKETVLIETSASPSVPYILKGLKQLQILPETVTHIIVTHIHLDHSGGAGLLMQNLPNARIIVHRKGARHLQDPTKLISSAKMVYGERFNHLFDPILPVPEDRIIIAKHGESMELAGRTLTFYETPGHSEHHISIHDSLTDGIYTGDTAGMQYPELTGMGIQLILPSTSPNQFNPDAMLSSIDLYEKLNPSCLYFGHYGINGRPEEVYRSIRKWIPIFLDCGIKAMEKKQSFQERAGFAARILHDTIITEDELADLGSDHAAHHILQKDLYVSAMGLIDYLQKK